MVWAGLERVMLVRKGLKSVVVVWKGLESVVVVVVGRNLGVLQRLITLFVVRAREGDI